VFSSGILLQNTRNLLDMKFSKWCTVRFSSLGQSWTVSSLGHDATQIVFTHPTTGYPRKQKSSVIKLQNIPCQIPIDYTLTNLLWSIWTQPIYIVRQQKINWDSINYSPQLLCLFVTKQLTRCNSVSRFIIPCLYEASCKYGIINFDKLLHLVSYFIMNYTTMHISTNIKFTMFVFMGGGGGGGEKKT
jgi:hypothetical protein